jgi:hypothetical protein
MHYPETQVKGSYQRQAAMLEQLRDCLEMERESLIQVDVDQLWELMEKKKSLVLEIEKTGNEIKGLMDQCFQESPESPRVSALKEWPWFRDVSRQTTVLKEGIQARLKENLSFIHDTLGFFDELIGIIVNNQDRSQGYEHMGKPQETRKPRIYSMEV